MEVNETEVTKALDKVVQAGTTLSIQQHAPGQYNVLNSTGDVVAKLWQDGMNVMFKVKGYKQLEEVRTFRFGGARPAGMDWTRSGNCRRRRPHHRHRYRTARDRFR